MFVYLNRRTSVLDTTISVAGYHQISRDLVYEKKDYYFGSKGDLDSYWYGILQNSVSFIISSLLFNICSGTFYSIFFSFVFRHDVSRICLSTRLGSISTVVGQSITLEMLKKKPDMVEAMRIRETAEEARALDDGQVPGDHLGAAGFDSAFFSHLKVYFKP